jgi:hypothetical protein
MTTTAQQPIGADRLRRPLNRTVSRQMKPSDEISSRFTFGRASYVKLGRGGDWEGSSIARGILRFGWKRVPLSEINAKDWSTVEQRIRADAKSKGASRSKKRQRCFATSCRQLAQTLTIQLTKSGSSPSAFRPAAAF